MRGSADPHPRHHDSRQVLTSPPVSSPGDVVNRGRWHLTLQDSPSGHNLVGSSGSVSLDPAQDSRRGIHREGEVIVEHILGVFKVTAPHAKDEVYCGENRPSLCP